MKKTESGIVHIQFIVLGVIVLAVVGLAAFRVGQSTTSKEQAKDLDTDTSLAEGITVKENEQKEVTIPAEKEEAAEEYVAPKPTTVTQKKPTTTETEKKDDKVWLKMEQIVAEQDGATLNISSKLPAAYTGTCNFKLYQEGQQKVYTTTQISNSTDCIGSLAVSGLPTYTGWELHVWFDSSDGKVSAYHKLDSVTLTAP